MPEQKRPQKHYRADSSLGHETISLTLAGSVISALEKIVEKEPDRNMSRYIEEIVSRNLPYNEKIPSRHKYGEYPQKKTLTFSVDFVSSIRRYGNLSMFIETVLTDKLRLK